MTAQAPACAEEDLSDPPPRANAVPAQPEVDLGNLLPPRPKSVGPAKPRSDLGRIDIRLAECVRRGAYADVGRLALPDDVPAKDLDESSRASWNELVQVETQFRAEVTRFVKLEARRQACERDHCGRLACIDRFLEDAQKTRTTLNDRRVTMEGNLQRSLEASIAKHPSGGAYLALGSLAERIERRRDDNVDPLLGKPIEYYENAKAQAGANADVTWWAGYLLAGAAFDKGDQRRSRIELEALARLPEREGTVDVLYRLAELEDEPTRRANAYRRVVEKAKAAGKHAGALLAVSASRSIEADVSIGRWRSALTAAAQLSSASRQAPESGDFAREAEEMMALALDALGVRDGSFPSVPADVFARVGKVLAEQAEARFDPRAAALAWTAIGNLAPDTPEGRDAKAKATTVSTTPAHDPKADARMRLYAVARTCGFQAFGSLTGGEVELSADAVSDGRGNATSRRKTGDDAIESAATCLRARAPAYFVGAKTSARATIVYIR